MKTPGLIFVSISLAMSLAIFTPGERSASACSLAAHSEHVLDGDPGDVEAPAAPEVLGTAVIRGNACDNGDSCQDLGFITLTLAPGSDDQTAPEDMGYRVSLSAGDDLGTGVLPEYDVRLFSNELFLVWLDGASDNQESIALTLEIIAIDRSGNESQPTLVDIADPGGPGMCTTDPTDPTEPEALGCAVSVQPGQPGQTGWAALGLALIGLCALRRRRTGN